MVRHFRLLSMKKIFGLDRSYLIRLALPSTERLDPTSLVESQKISAKKIKLKSEPETTLLHVDRDGLLSFISYWL